MSEQEESKRLVWPASPTEGSYIWPWPRKAVYKASDYKPSEETQGGEPVELLEGPVHTSLYHRETNTTLLLESSRGRKDNAPAPRSTPETQWLLEILQAADIPPECYEEVLWIWDKTPWQLRVSFAMSVAGFHYTMTKIREGVEALRQLANSPSWPPSRQEMHEWISGLDIGLSRVTLRFYVLLLTMFVDAQAHGKRRLRGRDLMNEVSNPKRVPEALKDAWRQHAQELLREHGKKSWSIAGQIARDETLNPMGRWTQRAVYNHIRNS